MVGNWPYSWGGGDDNGATVGILQEVDPFCDDRKVIGFDCSGLVKYSIYQGTGISLVHRAQEQYEYADKNGKLVPVSELQMGDLVFFGTSVTSITHVAIYIGNDEMVEAPGHNDDCSGMWVRRKTLRTSGLIEYAARLYE